MSATLDFLLSRLRGVTRNGDGLMALCPAHEDRRQSLSVKDGEKGVLVKCHAGCTAEPIVAALGLTIHELFFNSPTNNNGNGNPAQPPRIVTTYDYTDEKGALLYQNVRYEPKAFKQRRPDGRGGWHWNLNGVRRVPYHLLEVLVATEVLVLEGEKDVEKARSLGLCATTCGSASTPWLPEYTATLTGKTVAVIADADEPGREKARKIEQALLGNAKSVRVLEMPDAQRKGWDLSDWAGAGGTKEQLIQLINATPESRPRVVDSEMLLDSISAYIRRFVALSETQARVVVPWVIHTHAFEAADTTPYLAISSPEKQSGKTRLLEVLETLAANSWLTGRVTAAVLIRKIDKELPTLLLDESDAAFRGEKEYAETLRGVLNTGHRRGGKASCCVGQGANISFQDFSTFCPKAIAGIGNLPDTVADRSIPIRLKRAAPGERVARFRLRDAEAESTNLRNEIAAWTAPRVEKLRDARPSLPDALTDRPQDGAEPLLAIADAAGGDWPETARRALIELCGEAQVSEDSIGTTLLYDIRQIFYEKKVSAIPSSELIDLLAAIETSPWGEWKNGKPLSQIGLAKLLRPFGITPHNVRLGERVAKGYESGDFHDAFRRYLRTEKSAPLPCTGPQTATTATQNDPMGLDAISNRYTDGDVAVRKCEIATIGEACSGVAASNAPTSVRVHPAESQGNHRGCAGCYIVDDETGAKIHPPKPGTHTDGEENQ